MRVFLPLTVVWLWLVCVLPAMPVRSPEPVTPKFEGERLQVPPQQAEPWELETREVPAKWISAAKTMFALGLADPRGGEYRDIEVVVGDVWGWGAQVFKTRGWVLPRPGGEVQDYAVCWNGLVYPVVKVGAPANIRDPMLGLNADDSRFFLPRGEATMLLGVRVSPPGESGPPLKACLLLRLGEPALALEAARAQVRGEQAVRAKTFPGAASSRAREIELEPDPYPDWARQWAWALWDRALCAHMRGDDRLSLLTLRQLDAVRGGLDREMKARNVRVPEREREDGKKEVVDEASRYLPWLDGVFQKLLADQERRAKAPERPTAMEVGLDKYPEPAARARALIENLQEVATRQWGQPGGLDSYLSDPIVAELVKVGEPAVEPLLEAWTKEGMRLTRSVSFGRDFDSRRYLHPISQPIATCLGAIMNASIEDFRVLPGGVTPESVREYWRTWGGVTPVERWFRIFADDAAGEKAWKQMAEQMVRPASHRSVGNGWVEFAELKPGEKEKLAGETLRTKRMPSLSELWERRAAQLIPADFISTSNYGAQEDACRFVMQFVKWDEKAALPMVRKMAELCRETGLVKTRPWTAPPRHLTRFTTILVRNGEDAALDRYTAWLVAQSGGEQQEEQPFHRNRWMGGSDYYSGAQLFKPLWMNPNVASVGTTIDRLFAGANPVMKPLMEDRKAKYGPLVQMIRTPMIRFSAVQRYVREALEDRSEMGEIEIDSKGVRRGTLTFREDPPREGAVIDTKVKFRICDFYVWQLSRWKGMPEVELTWPIERRDAARAEAARLMRDPGELFREEKPAKLPTDIGFDRDDED